jgi:hypothetical protein
MAISECCLLLTHSIEPIIGHFQRSGLTRYDAVIRHFGDKTGRVKAEDVAKRRQE